MTQLLAGETRLGEIKGPGPLGDPNAAAGGALALLQKLLSNIIGFLTIGAILWFTLQIIFAGYSWITSAGDPKAVAAAREKILFGIVGLVVVFGALVLVSLIGSLLGVDVLNIQEALKAVKIGG